nr:hypothetical protein [Cryobacterium sp. MDB2-10]
MDDVHRGLAREIDPELVTDLPGAPLFEKVFRDRIPQLWVPGDLARPGAFARGLRQNLRRSRSISFLAWRPIPDDLTADRRRASAQLGRDLTQAFSDLQRIGDLDPLALGEVS